MIDVGGNQRTAGGNFIPDEFRRKVGRHAAAVPAFRGMLVIQAVAGHHAGRTKSLLRLQFGRTRHHGERFQGFRCFVRAALGIRIAVVYRLESLFPAQIFPDGDKFHFRRNDALLGVITLCHRRLARSTQGALLPHILFHIPPGPYPGGTQGGKPLLRSSPISSVPPGAGAIVHAHRVIRVGGAVGQQGIAQNDFPHGYPNIRVQTARNINAAGTGIRQIGGIVHGMNAVLFRQGNSGNETSPKNGTSPFNRTPCGGIIRIRFEGFCGNSMPFLQSQPLFGHPCRTGKRITRTFFSSKRFPARHGETGAPKRRTPFPPGNQHGEVSLPSRRIYAFFLLHFSRKTELAITTTDPAL